MSRRYLGTTGVALLALLAFPSAGHASIWDWIWSMSGPQLVGGVLHCEYDFPNNKLECRAIDYKVTRGRFQLQPRSERRMWLSLDTGFYTGTGKDSEGNVFRPFKDNMIAFEPLFEVRSYTSPQGVWSWHHGLAGLTIDRLIGTDYAPFNKAGLKFRPVGVTINKKHNASFVLRYYPRGFTADEFGIGPRQHDLDRDGELTWGFTYGFLWGPP